MQLLTTQQELVALDLGMQAINLRGAQVQAAADATKISQLEARIAELETPASAAVED